MFSIETGVGFWNPLLWVACIGIAFLIVYIIRSLGKKDFKKDAEQMQPFLSGNVQSPDQMQVKASNLYWGFTSSLNWLFTILRRMHTGNCSDYVLWFVIVLALFFVMGLVM